jgi:hypothetical protein
VKADLQRNWVKLVLNAVQCSAVLGAGCIAVQCSAVQGAVQCSDVQCSAVQCSADTGQIIAVRIGSVRACGAKPHST